MQLENNLKYFQIKPVLARHRQDLAFLAYKVLNCLSEGTGLRVKLLTSLELFHLKYLVID